MKTARTFAILSAALLACACSKAEEAPARATTETDAPVATAEAPAATSAAAEAGDFQLSPDGAAFIAALSPMELGQARLSCVEPLRTAKAWPKIWSPEMAAELASVEDFSRTKLLTSEPLNTLRIDQARAIMDAGPKFNANSQPTAEDIEGVGQCIQLAKHYAAEQAAG